MPFNLSLVLLFAVTAAVAGVDWNNFPDAATLEKLKYDLAKVPWAKNGNVVGYELFCDGKIAVCIVERTSDDFRLYRFDWENEGVGLYKGVLINASTLDHVKVIGEDLFSTCTAEGYPLGAAATSKTRLLRLWETNKEDAKFAAIFQYEDNKFGFTGCAVVTECSDDGVMSKSVKRLATYGYSQKIDSDKVAEASLEKYLANEGAFGNVILLPALYSGFEDLAKAAFEAKENEIIRELEKRVDFSNLILKNAWSVSGHTKCVALFSYTSTKLERNTYLFVSYTSSITENQITLTNGPIFGGFAITEAQTMMGVVDYLKPNHISGYISDFDTTKVQTEAGKLVLAADYAARNYTEMNIDDTDSIPLANQPFTVAKLVQETSAERSWEQYASIFLHYAIEQENTSLEELTKAFGVKVRDLVEAKISSQSLPTVVVAKEHFSLLETPIIASLVPGNGLPSALSAVLEARRQKILKKAPHPFSISFESAFRRGTKATAVYSLVGLGDDEHHFRVDIHGEGTRDASIVIGEFQTTVASITSPDVVEHEIAAGYKAYFESIAPESPHSHVAKVITALEFTARKHYFQRRRDYTGSPHLNHVIGVARILILEGKIEDIDVILAALLHDTLEDTSAFKEDVEFVSNAISAGFVVEVTDAMTTKAGTEAKSEEKKALQNEHATKQSPGAVLVKMADRIYNLRDFGRHCDFDYQETRRRWQFSNAQKLLTAFKYNVEVVNESVWKKNPQFLAAYQNLRRVFQGILDEHLQSLNSVVEL